MTLEQTHQTMLLEMQSVSQDSIQQTLDGQNYDDTKIENWSNIIISRILKKMKETKTPQFKFIAHCMVLSSRSQFVNDVQMAIWDSKEDLKITTKWANETMQCIVSLWAFRTRYD